ncbi:MAG TPA: hypothetical protein VGG44_08915 [Tepidisphaeraceae bacterium]|jgi:hypothetical protein
MTVQIPDTEAENGAAWHPQAEMVLSAFEAANPDDRRRQVRNAFRVRASLKLFTDCSDEPARVLYTRDANHRGIGFVTRTRLPLGYGGIIEIPSLRNPAKILTIQCTLSRCRLAAAGWYEGALHFNRDQWEFLVESECKDSADQE